jgi:hypothetical protein
MQRSVEHGGLAIVGLGIQGPFTIKTCVQVLVVSADNLKNSIQKISIFLIDRFFRRFV